METKEQLIENIKQWVAIEKELVELKAKIKEKNVIKKSLAEGLIQTMKTNQIDCFDIKGGSILYKQNKVKKNITGKTLMGALEAYFKNDKGNAAQEITQFVLDNREESVKECIKHRINKNN
uniref:Uncharacterized protein n=1 Tax=viral metagenome TaxID=1070528 RepID=A0A6C0LKI4_9ZZZZ